MNKDEIKKAFDICYDPQQGCTDCPLLKLERQNGGGCKHNLFVSVIDLITEQEKEIERFKAENEELTKVVSSKVYDLIDNAKEIADAREAWEKQAKIEAVKDFAEKLKEKARGLTLEGNKGAGFYIGNILLTNDIDELLKEYEDDTL